MNLPEDVKAAIEARIESTAASQAPYPNLEAHKVLWRDWMERGAEIALQFTERQKAPGELVEQMEQAIISGYDDRFDNEDALKQPLRIAQAKACANIALQYAEQKAALVDQWISVEERLPQEATLVLCFGKARKDLMIKEKIHLARFAPEGTHSAATFSVHGSPLGSGITHWRPLPAAPHPLNT